MAFRLVPKEEIFFDLFQQASNNLSEAGKVLAETMEHFDRLPEYAHKLERLEHAGDQITHDLMARLNKTFITPIDREDIHRLASALDDVLDFIEAVTERFMLYKIKTATHHAKELAKVVAAQVEEIHRAMGELRKLSHKHVMEHCIEVNRLENQGDRVARAAVSELFDSQQPPLEVMKWRELYDLLETATDKCEDVAVVIEGIVLKHS